MLQNAIEIREVQGQDEEHPRYEVYDNDTGTSLGLFESQEKAEAMREKMQASNKAREKGGQDADPAVE